MKRLSLKRSLNLALFGLALLPLLVAGVLSIGVAGLNERDAQLLLYTRRAARVGSEVGNYLELQSGHLDSLNRYREVRHLAAVERTEMFETLLAQQPAIFEVVLLDAQRRTLTHVSARTPIPRPGALGWLTAADLDAAASSQRTLMGAIEVDPNTGDPEFALIQPLVGLRSGELEGYLAARCRMAQVWQIVERLARGTPDESLIVDRDGRVIAHRNPSVVLSGSRYDVPAATTIGRGPDGRWSVIGVVELNVLGRKFSVVNTVPFATAFAGLFRLTATFLAISLATLGGAFLLVLALRRRVLRPVDRLTEAARRIQGGDWTTQVEVPREDELGQLAVTFNAMTAQLRATHFGLEERIAERTAELARARDEAERASRSKSEFLSSMSHELRTPMNAILGFSQLLESDTAPPLSGRQRSQVKEILRAGDHLLELINEVLDLARVEAGKLQLSLEPLRLKPLVDHCLSLVEAGARERGITITAASSQAEDCHVLADPTRLRQVLLNLLSNAIKFNRQGGSVHVDCATDGDAVRISVRDSGEGLSAEQQLRLFQGFERLDADKAAIQGAGIGLALSKRLVEMMRGEIGVDSVVGSGSTFWVRLQRAETPQPGTPAPTGAARAPLPVADGVRTVLYIEDNPVNVTLMEAIIALQPGLRLITASSPARGLDMARAERPDLILLDIQLPGMDGYEVLRRLRSADATRAIPVVAVSANAMRGDIERGHAAGFADYLTKPLDVQQVLDAVRRELAAAGRP